MKRLFLTLVVALALAGCGAEAGPTVASAADPSTAPGPTATVDPIAQFVEARRQWVGCIREQGFDVPDPDAKGTVNLSKVFDGRPKTDPKWMAAERACEKFQREIPAELDRVPPMTPEQIANERAYAACRRANGSVIFPDPGPDGRPVSSSYRELTKQELIDDARAAAICEPVRQGRAPDLDATPPVAEG